MSTPNIHGIIGYTITPFSTDGQGLDLDALGRSIDRLIDSGVHAIAPLGSTGEGAYLSDAEWDQVSEFSIARVAGRVPTVVSVSDLTTAKAVRRARFAQAKGADVVMVLPASYWKLSEAEILAHYQAIGASIDLPIMLYNNPATSGIDMSVELILRIFNAVDNVTMVKESTGDIQRMHKLQLLGEGQVPFYNGCNPLALEAFGRGQGLVYCRAEPDPAAQPRPVCGRPGQRPEPGAGVVLSSIAAAGLHPQGRFARHHQGRLAYSWPGSRRSASAGFSIG